MLEWVTRGGRVRQARVWERGTEFTSILYVVGFLPASTHDDYRRRECGGPPAAGHDSSTRWKAQIGWTCAGLMWSRVRNRSPASVLDSVHR